MLTKIVLVLLLFVGYVVVIISGLFVLPQIEGQYALRNHTIYFLEGNYSENNVIEVDASREFILLFPNISYSNPYRISAHAESNVSNPALIVVRQPEMVMSWQIPMMVSAGDDYIPYENTARTLCFGQNVFRGRSGRNDVEITRDFSISISTSSIDPLLVTIQADEVYDYHIKTGKQYSATISASEPVYYYYKFPADKESLRRSAFVGIDSEDDVCLIASIQEPLCPVEDLNEDIKFAGIFQTVDKKGGMFVSSEKYPNGFFLVFIAMGDNLDCHQDSSILPMPIELRREIVTQNRTSVVQFTVTEGISGDEFLAATMVVLGVNLGFSILFICGMVSLYWYKKRMAGKPLMDSHNESNTDDDVITKPNPDLYLQKKEFKLQDFITNFETTRKKSNNYVWHITNIGIFYGIPVVQLMVSYQRTLIQTGDLDMCYHNFLCAHHFADVSDFNHIYSNIGYILLGILFLFVTLLTQKNRIHYPNCGIPRQYGIFYAMGVALIIEGMLSASYHICPNQANYQFDTSFMYVMTVLCMVNLYQNRHPSITASAYGTFTILGAAVFLAMVGILTNSTGIMVVFAIAHICLCIVVSLKIYFMGHVITGMKEIFSAVNQGEEILEALAPIRKRQFILLCLANLCNLVLAIVGIALPSTTDFGTFLLAILMANGVFHVLYYISMKITHGERICYEAIIYMILSLLAWGSSAYFFVNPATSWMVTPATSRQLNTDCMFMNFYDKHDIWHLLSAPALFFTFMMLMHLDNDIAEVPRSEIAAF